MTKPKSRVEGERWEDSATGGSCRRSSSQGVAERYRNYPDEPLGQVHKDGYESASECTKYSYPEAIEPFVYKT